MKRISFQKLTLIFTIIVFVFSSCRKDTANGHSNGAGTGIGDVRPTGNPIEAPIRKIIGTNGGSIESRDGRLTIAIPPGALTENTQISITAITSTSDASMGNSYRLEPDIKFSKPVTITMSYEDYKDSVSGGSCGIGIGYQDSLGVWQLLTNRSVDESLHKISVQSNHFSDWTFLTPFKIAPAYSLITPGEEVIVKIGAYVRITEDPCSFHNPNNPESLSVEQFYEVPNTHMEKWISLAGNTTGAGKLKRLIVGASYQSSNYDAPDINPTKILAYFPKMIVPFPATIEVRPVSLGVFITVGSTTYVYDDCYAYGSEGDVGVVWSRSMGGRTYYGGVSWKHEGAGPRNWSDDTQFLWEPEAGDPPLIYQSYWDDGLKISSGQVNITKYGKIGEIVEGTFTLSNAGIYQPAAGSGDIEYKGTKQIKGSFRVIRK